MYDIKRAGRKNGPVIQQKKKSLITMHLIIAAIIFLAIQGIQTVMEADMILSM